MPCTVLFTGHMIDAPGRAVPRFPPAAEASAARRLEEALRMLQAGADGELAGIAGGACGGDLLFHEACETLGIPTALYLALPVPQFLQTSVAFAGPEWEARFLRLAARYPVYVLQPEPRTGPVDPAIWEATNQWMLDCTLQQGAANAHLLALWDGQSGDGPGGTAHLIQLARRQGIETHILPLDPL